MNPLHTKRLHLRGLRGNEYYSLIQQDYAAENKAMGLTWNGRLRRRRIRFDLAQLKPQDRKIITNRERRQRLARLAKEAAKITRNSGVMDRLLLQSVIDAFAISLGECFSSLSRHAQGKALELEKHLSAIRQKLT